MKGAEVDTKDGLYVDVLGDRRSVSVRTTAAFDPEGKRMRGLPPPNP